MIKPGSVPLSCAILILSGSLAAAHDAPTGWSYDVSCCSGIDCRPIPASAVKESPGGYLITLDNETVPYDDKGIKDSPDALYHWRSVDGLDDGPTICLYVPPRAS
jgi:hypothetical protein